MSAPDQAPHHYVHAYFHAYSNVQPGVQHEPNVQRQSDVQPEPNVPRDAHANPFVAQHGNPSIAQHGNPSIAQHGNPSNGNPSNALRADAPGAPGPGYSQPVYFKDDWRTAAHYRHRVTAVQDVFDFTSELYRFSYELEGTFGKTWAAAEARRMADYLGEVAHGLGDPDDYEALH